MAQSADVAEPAEEWSLSSSARFKFEDPFDTESSAKPVQDPMETVNRSFYRFNDRVYHWVLKPVAKGYEKVLPEPARISFRMFFTNVKAPVRVANCLFQRKVKGAGRETGRFLINATVGIGGLFDPASYWNIEPQEEDLDQTLGFYGVPPGAYVNWPIFGPSSIRGTIGTVGDSFLNPLFYLGIPSYGSITISAQERINATSLTLGEYEQLTRSALDPYIGLRNAYFQYREQKIKE